MSAEKLWQIIRRQGTDIEPGGVDGGATDAGDELPRATMPRRTFIEMVGFSVAAAALTGCRAPEQKIIPYVKQPVEFTPGVANWYASLCGGCEAGCGALVKVRDGRPIKLEGNPEHPLNRGGLCAVAHSLIYGLYDADRLRQPLLRSQAAEWADVDQEIIWKLTTIRQSGGRVRVLTLPSNSPASLEVIDNFLKPFADGKHIVYRPFSNAAVSEAHKLSHGVAAMPFYHFERARLIVSFGADFLGAWGSPAHFTRGYAEGRELREDGRKMNRLVQFESRLSLTGSNADRRYKLSTAEEKAALLLLAKLVAAKTAATNQADFAASSTTALPPQLRRAVERTAGELFDHRGESLVVCGASDVDAQYLVNFINQTLGNYGKTLELDARVARRAESDRDMVELVRQMNAGEIAALIIVGANPVYDYFASREFVKGLEKVELKISLNPYLDETSALAEYVCPRSHALESWDDVEAAPGVFAVNQPTIAPLFQTRAWQESLMRWTGDSRRFYDALRARWREKIFPLQTRLTDFDEFWDRTLHDGVCAVEMTPAPAPAFVSDSLSAAIGRLNNSAVNQDHKLNLVLYEKVTLRDGRFANNPWLQELPDPLTKVTWDNYACVSPRLAEQLQLEEGRVVRLTRGDIAVELPVYVQPQQHDDCVAIAVGYGRARAGKVGNGVGVSAYPFVAFANQTFQYAAPDVGIEATPRHIQLATTQRYHRLDGRPLIKELSLAQFIKDGASHASDAAHGGEGEHGGGIYKDHDYSGHKWEMAIDLNACVGCSACMLSCQAENNVPVVGRDEVRRQREMHWLRIDRYFEGAGEGGGDAERVVFQPVMCAQCENASCESVCPVLATVHSSEGLNMQVYNRCVGTRYCANNCPYKVRRFNWFDYPHDDPLANLALNPDVTVRTRGVMEKCSFCVQRIEEVKIRARNEGRLIGDGEVQTACQQSCPTRAITFGDAVRADSRVNKLKTDRRDYILLEELNLRPATSYLAKIRNDEGVEA